MRVTSSSAVSMATVTACRTNAASAARRAPRAPATSTATGWWTDRTVQGFVDCIFTGAGCASTDVDADGLTTDADAAGDIAAFVENLVVDGNRACP